MFFSLMLKLSLGTLVLLLSVMASFCAHAEVINAKHHSFKLSQLVEADDVVWGMDFISDNELLYTTKNGKLFKLTLSTSSLTEIT